MSRVPIPLSQRKFDIVYILFFIAGFIIIVVIDIEALLVPKITSSFKYPVWPPKPVVDIIHWWAKNFDPIVYYRPIWYKATIIIDVVVYAPIYIAAIYAFIVGRDWIRLPLAVYSSSIMTNVTLMFADAFFGQNKATHPVIFSFFYAIFWVFPFLALLRVAKKHPFTVEKKDE